ncbi:PPC domain-containing DNA-binding protein [Streptomyces violens]|uniref:PPC domain-containing DNA-binding protein n=1 Tax=Streptomyces violens TaxID=66377 RepID=UPI0004C25840|nr:PPC domain-containing DNA-binding protein [Streptomyces violens]
MKTRLLYEESGLRTFALVMDKGDEAAARITAFAREQGISGAGLTAIGACRQATLGYFDPKIMDYRSTHFDGQMEVLSLLGDIATHDGEPVLHAHLVLGRKDSSVIGGHLQKCVVFPTMEVIVTETPAHLRKRIDPETGLALIAPEASDGPPDGS